MFWIDVQDVPRTPLVIGGRTDRGVDNDLEPIIEVPISAMKEIVLA